MTLDMVAALFVGAMILVSFSTLRRNARAVSHRRTQQLDTAAEMLSLHASAMEQFLADPAAPVVLKRLLIAASDALSDREVLRRVTALMVSEPGRSRLLAGESHGLQSAMADLRAHQPGLHDVFTSAVLGLVFGATLRWPETAPLFEIIGVSAAKNPKLDFDVAVAAATIRSGLFGVPLDGMALA